MRGGAWTGCVMVRWGLVRTQASGRADYPVPECPPVVGRACGLAGVLPPPGVAVPAYAYAGSCGRVGSGQSMWKNFPRGVSTRSYVWAPK